MLYLLQEIHLLEYFSLAEVILHVVLFNGFDGHLLSSEFVDTQCYLSKGALTDEFDKLIEIQGGWRQFIVLLDILFDVLDQLVTFLQDGIVHFGRWLGAHASGG